MNILVIGSGGREHALAWTLARDGEVSGVWACPGSDAIAEVATRLDADAGDARALAAAARAAKIDVTVVGPEAPLAAGVVDTFQRAGLAIVGPVRAAARLEASKVYAKEICRRYHIPTAPYEVFHDRAALASYLECCAYPRVIKVDGLAAGKGVMVCPDRAAAETALAAIYEQCRFGEAARQVLVEDCLTGPELSLMALCDGETLLTLPSARDHKRLKDGDQGPNTGGMGAIAPAPGCTVELESEIIERILVPAVHAMRKEGHPYRGFLYAGLMLTDAGPMLLEFNCRLGDPEAQAILMRCDGGLARCLAAAARGELAEAEPPRWNEGVAVCVVLASAGYPETPDRGRPIEGLEAAADLPDTMVFHAGTARGRSGAWIQRGGRVLGVTARGTDLAAARERAYARAGRIRFQGMQYRRDIGGPALGAGAAGSL